MQALLNKKVVQFPQPCITYPQLAFLPLLFNDSCMWNKFRTHNEMSQDKEMITQLYTVSLLAYAAHFKALYGK
jgi:hypothetical protein